MRCRCTLCWGSVAQAQLAQGTEILAWGRLCYSANSRRRKMLSVAVLARFRSKGRLASRFITRYALPCLLLGWHLIKYRRLASRLQQRAAIAGRRSGGEECLPACTHSSCWVCLFLVTSFWVARSPEKGRPRGAHFRPVPRL